jgi:hypothetical protein
VVGRRPWGTPPETWQEGVEDRFLTTDLNTLLTGLYVKIDDYLGEHTRSARPLKLSDAELLTLAVTRVLFEFRSEARWLRFVPSALPAAFSYLPGQSGYNKRLRNALPLIKRLIRALAADTGLWTDSLWLVDSTPVERARSRPTVKRSNLAGWAGDSYCRVLDLLPGGRVHPPDTITWST